MNTTERPPHRPAPSDRLAELESVRGLAALLVMLYHIPNYNPVTFDWTWIRQGHLMVPLFFVLSGFVMYRAYDTRLKSPGAIGRFVALRLGRLYPVHLVFLLAFVGIEMLKAWYAQRHPVAAGYNVPWGANDIPALLQHLTLTQAVLPLGAMFTFNVPSWSISTEFYTYLLFALCVWLLGAQRLWGYTALCIGAFVAQLVWPEAEAVLPLLICIAGFFLGTLVGRATDWLGSTRRAPQALILASLGLILVGISWPAVGERVQLGFIYAGAASFMVFGSLAPGASVVAWLRGSALQWLGARSYALYMCHAFVIWLVTNTLRIGLHRPEASHGGLMIPQLPVHEAVGAFFLIFIGSLALADATHRWIEVPMRARTRRWVEHMPQPAALGARP